MQFTLIQVLNDECKEEEKTDISSRPRMRAQQLLVWPAKGKWCSSEEIRNSDYPPNSPTPAEALHQRFTNAPRPLSAHCSTDSECDSAKQFICKCACSAPAPALPLSPQFNISQGLYPVEGTHQTVCALKELTAWSGGNTESSVHHSFIQLTFTEHLQYTTVPTDNAEASQMSWELRTQLSSQSRAEDSHIMPSERAPGVHTPPQA